MITQVLISQPKNYPTELVELMTKFFSSRDVVKNAYLAQAHYSTDPLGTPPKIIIGLEVVGEELESFVSHLASYLHNQSMDLKTIDFVDAVNSSYSRYFSSTAPFFSSQPNS